MTTAMNQCSKHLVHGLQPACLCAQILRYSNEGVALNQAIVENLQEIKL